MGPAQVQTIKVEVKGQDVARPKVVWVQSDTDIWKATFGDGTQVETGTFSSGADALPLKRRTDFKLDMTSYAPDSMRDNIKNPFSKAYVKGLEIDGMEWTKELSYEPIGDKPLFQKGSIMATIKASTGYPLDYSKKYKYNTRYDGADKFMAEYYIPMLVHYKGYVIEKKRMRVLENVTLQLNQSKNLKAEISTREYDQADFSDKWFDVSSDSNTVWKSANEAVAKVDKNGKVTAIGKGTTKIRAEWKKDPYYLYGEATITVGEGGGGGTDPGDDPVPTGGCTRPTPSGNVIDVPLNDPSVSAVIKGTAGGVSGLMCWTGFRRRRACMGMFWRKVIFTKTSLLR